MPFCGSCGVEWSGECCHLSTANGIVYLSVTLGGARLALGMRCWLFFSQQADWQDVSIDGTINRAHACAAGYQQDSAKREALGRSKGGFSCKVHAICDAHGLPLKFILTGGQAAECKQAIPLLQNVSAEAVLADKAYDTNEFRDWLKARGIKAVIPPKTNRKDDILCDFWHYKERHAIECLFGKLKYYRRISTRYDKKTINYRGMLCLASIFIWLR